MTKTGNLGSKLTVALVMALLVYSVALMLQGQAAASTALYPSAGNSSVAANSAAANPNLAASQTNKVGDPSKPSDAPAPITQPEVQPANPADSIVITGSIGMTNPVQNGRLFRGGVASTCGAPNTESTLAGSYHYSIYTFTNSTGSTACYTVSLNTACTGNNFIFAGSYVGAFDPNNILTNLQGDMGISPNPTGSYGVNVPAGATMEVVVAEVTANAGCPSYVLTVDSPAIGGTPTVTGTPLLNTPTATLTPIGCSAVTLLTDTVEIVPDPFFSNSITATWVQTTTSSHSPTHSWFVAEPPTVSDQQLTLTPTISLPAGSSNISLSFWHIWSFEFGGTSYYDGGVLEYSTDGGATWIDAGSLITQNGYGGVISSAFNNPLGGRNAWVAASPGNPTYVQTVVNLSSLAGQTIKFRFRMGSDSSVGSTGWNVDDIQITDAPLTCGTPSPTATSTAVLPTDTATATATVAATNTPQPTATLPLPTVTLPLPTITLTTTGTPLPTVTITTTGTPLATQTPGGATATPMATQTPGGGTATPMVTATPTDCPNPFVDINGNTFYIAIHYLNCRGVINGLDSTHYGPAGTSTRGQFAKVVVLGFGTPLFTPSSGQDFVDVPPSYFAYVYIESGFHAGILSGYDTATCTAHGLGNPCYLPNLPITRGQLTKLVVNAGGYTLITPVGGTQDFIDVPPTNVFYVSIETAYHNGIVHGYPGRLYLPNANIRRDEMAQIVYTGIINRPQLGLRTDVRTLS